MRDGGAVAGERGDDAGARVDETDARGRAVVQHDAAVRGRILAIKPGYYTRMGAAIRQSAAILAEQPASRRLLLIITDGKPQISGSFTQQSAKTLADQLKFGALPIGFTVQSSEVISATLGSTQLFSGLIAGLINGTYAVLLTDLFPTRVRFSGVALAFNISFTLFSGTGQGSGFFVAPDLILTNDHVALNAKRVKVVLINGATAYATTLRSDPARDVALLRIEGGAYTPLPLRLEPVALTEEVYAVGSPLDPSLAGTVTRGIVSQIKDNEYGQPLIQADASIQHGSSGGPLLDAKGNVIGISQSALTDQGEYSVGINFFIPIADGVQRLGMQLQ